jgi:hypothetical protein
MIASERSVVVARSLPESIACRGVMVAEARACCQDTSAWDQHPAALESEARPMQSAADGLDAATLCDHLERRCAGVARQSH